MNLFDVMRQAGGGNGFSSLGAQFGLSEEQVNKAVQAFLPAFSAGLKRSTNDPLGLAEFMRKLSAGDFARAYDSPGFSPGAAQSGKDALGFLFGSPQVAEAVARQAAQFTGIATEKMQEIMAPLAAIMFGGFARQAPLANPMLDALMKQFSAVEPGKGAAPKGPLDRYEEEQAADSNAGADDILRTQREMMQAGLAAFQSGTAAWQKAVAGMTAVQGAGAGGTDAGSQLSGRDLFGDMFEPGMRLSETYQKEMEALVRKLRPGGKDA